MKELHFFANDKFAVKSEHFTPRAGDKVIEIMPSVLCDDAGKLKALNFITSFARTTGAHKHFCWYLAAMAGDYGAGFAANKQAHFDYLIADRPLKIVFFGMEIPPAFF